MIERIGYGAVGMVGVVFSVGVIVALWYQLKLQYLMSKNTLTLSDGENVIIPVSRGLITTFYYLLKAGFFPTEKTLMEAFSSASCNISKEIQQLKMCQSPLLTLPSIETWNPEIIRMVSFSKDFDKPSLEKGYGISFVDESILVVKQDKWQKHKVALSPAFDWKQIQSMATIFLGVAEQHCERISNEPKSLLIFDWIHKAALDCIGKGGFGYDFNAVKGVETEEMKQYSILMKELDNPIHFIPTLDRLLGTQKAFKHALNVFDQFMIDVLKHKREEVTGDDFIPRDILDCLLSAQDSNTLSDTEIIDNLKVFFLAGHETTSGAIYSIIQTLSQYPDIQSDLRKEILACGELNYESIRSMELLERVVKETLRLFPPANIFIKEASNDLSIGNINITKGTLVLSNVLKAQTDTDIWGPDAEEFKPERWRSENRRSHPKNGFLAFSLGLRQCIGNNFATLEIKSFIAVLLSKLRFSPDPNTKEKYQGTIKTVYLVNPKLPLLITPLE